MRLLCFVVGLLLALVLVAGCAEQRKVLGLLGDGGSGGSSTTSAGSGGDIFPTSGSGGDPVCSGACVPSRSAPFVGLSMFWIGAPDEVPDCPVFAPDVGFEGFADVLAAPSSCPSCSCSPASCLLPEGMHATAAKCVDGDGAAETSFDAPAAWEGVCTDQGAIPAGLLCGGMPCAQSLTIDAPTVEPCKPITAGTATIAPPSWATMARECRINVDDDGGGCPNGRTCAPEPPEGFDLCLFIAGDDPAYECPIHDYPRRVVVYDTWPDERACSPCACGEAEGADCAALVSVFSDAACGAVLASNVLAMDQPGCFDLPAGSALGSKSAVFVVDEPGSCAQSGGELSGEIHGAGPLTLCCRSEEVPPK